MGIKGPGAPRQPKKSTLEHGCAGCPHNVEYTESGKSVFCLFVGCICHVRHHCRDRDRRLEEAATLALA